MEGTSSNPSIDKALQVLSEKVPGGAPCPICRHREWSIPDDLIANVGVWYQDPEADAGGEQPSPWAPLLTVTLICVNCSFIRQHYIEPPNEEMAEAA